MVSSFNTLTPKRLSRALTAGHKKLSSMRKTRYDLLSHYTGRFYGNGGSNIFDSNKVSPINLLHSAITTLVPNLVFKNPKVVYRSNVIEYKEYAEMLGLMTTLVLERINFVDEIRKAVIDSMMAAGFIKNGLAAGDGIVSVDGVNIELGAPFVQRIDPDDMVLDPAARDWSEQTFIANRFSVTEETLFTMGVPADTIKKMSSRQDEVKNKKNVSSLSGKVSKDDELFKKIELIDVWVPSQNLVYTAAWRPGWEIDEFIKVVEWNGLPQGPYDMLGYTFVPDNILPVPPASIWFDLHLLANRIARKIGRQAERIKKILIYDGEALDDIEALRKAPDGDTVRVNNIQGVKEVEYGGTTDNAYVYIDWLKQQFSEQSGNIEQLAGIKSQAPTLGQSQILEANASVRLADLQNQVSKFMAAAARHIGYYLNTDPLIEVPLIRREDGVEKQIIYSPEARRGTFFDYTLEVVPFSSSRQDPSTRVRRILEFATSVLPAAAQASQILGPSFNINKFLKDIVKEMGLDGIEDWVDIKQFKDVFMARFLSETNGDGKANRFAGLIPSTSFNPGQPNPGQMGPTGGVTPSQELNSMAQELSAELQNGPNKAV